MLVLGHAGITLGALTLLNGLVIKAIPQRGEPTSAIDPVGDIPGTPASEKILAWFARLNNRIDIRVLLVGALLPDIIDKPLGHIILQDYLSSGRTYAHTLLFFILITLAGLFLLKRTGRTWMLGLSIGTFIHLILDEMWRGKWRETFLWPMYGLEFPRADLTGWTGNIWYNLLHEPAVYVPEIIGGVVIILFLWVLLRNGRLISFSRHGRLYDK